MTFPRHSAKITQSDLEVLQPRTGRNQPGLGSSPFARHYLGNHCYFLFLQVLRCFSSLRLPLISYRERSLVFNQRGCPIRISVDHQVCALPHRFSQLIASFVASESLGIPRVPLLTSMYSPRKASRFASCQSEDHAGRTLFSLLLPYVKERIHPQLGQKEEQLSEESSS